MRRTLFLAALLLLSTSRVALAQQPDTLALGLLDALERSLRVSPEVGQRQAQEAFAEARYGEARASRFLTRFEARTAHSVAPGLYIPPGNDLPKSALYLNPDVQNDWSDLAPFNMIEVEIGQPLWTWDELSGNIRAARFGIAVEEAGVRRKALEVALRTGEIYYNVLLTQALVRLIDRVGGIIERAEREVQRLLEEGATGVDQADLFQLRITEQEYQRRVVEVRQQRELALTALNLQLFMPGGVIAVPAADFLVPIDFVPEPLGVYVELALANRPEIDQAEAGIAARQALVEVAASEYYPKLFLGVTAGYSYAPNRYNQQNPFIYDPLIGSSIRAGLSLRQDLNFFQTEARVDQAKAELAEVRYQKEAALQLVRFEVEEAYRTLKIAQATLEARDEALQLSEEWLRTEQINFDLGFGDPENLVRAVRTNLELQIAYYQAVNAYNVAVLELLQAVGVLDNPAKVGTLVDL